MGSEETWLAITTAVIGMCFCTLMVAGTAWLVIYIVRNI